VHRAYLDRSPGPTVSGRQAPAWSRRVLPRHRLIFAAERRYFSADPRVILCTSAQEVADLSTFYGVNANRCRVMPNGFDPTIFNSERRDEQRDACRERLGMKPEELSILFVANELHRKGFGTLIEALAEAELPKARVDVVGKVLPGDYEARIDRLGLTSGIHWHGSTSDVFPYYAAADLFVLPTQYEPFGIVIVEALACGLPVITSRLAGAAQAVEAGASGRLLADPTDVHELARYLVEGSSPDRRGQWSSGAPAAARPYAWPTIFAEVEVVLRQSQRGGEPLGHGVAGDD